MKFILLVIGIILLVLVFRGSSEKFDVNEAIFNEVEIPTDSDLAKDPYYQKIKNRDWVCACGEGREKNSRNECVPLCPTGQSRFTDDNCYPPCPTGQTRHTNAVCYPPCPSGEFRNPSGVCQCTPQQPLYDLFTNHDLGGNNLGGTCLQNNAGGVWPAWANEAKARCDNNPECKAYNLVYSGGAWGGNWGTCMKTKSDTPSRVPLSAKIDYYRKIETSRNNNGVCSTECPAGKTNVNGICQWNPCPAEQTRDAYGVCQWNPCPTDQTRDSNGVCQCIQQPYYDRYPNSDIGGFDLGGSDNCLKNNAGGVWPAWANEAKARCDSNPNCKAYNLISWGGAWGNNWGSCMKTTPDIPTPVPVTAKIDYYKKVEGTLSKDPDGVCRPPCPSGQTRHTNGMCYPPCPSGQTRDGNGVCQWPPCPDNSTVNQTTGQCTCNSGFEVALAFGGSYPGSTGRTSVDRGGKCDRLCAAGVSRDVAGICGGNTPIPGISLNFFNPGAR